MFNNLNIMPMKTKIYLQPQNALGLIETPQQSIFPKEFNKISLDFFEPPCPFCGIGLKNATCQCQDFKNARQKLLSSYPFENLNIEKSNGIDILHGFFIDMDNLTMAPAPFFPELVKLFDEGSTAGCRPNTWFVSCGNFENQTLKFFMRKKGETQNYLCEIKKVNITLPALEITIFQTNSVTEPYGKTTGKTIYGRYHINVKKTIIDKFSYQKFLEILNKK